MSPWLGLEWALAVKLAFLGGLVALVIAFAAVFGSLRGGGSDCPMTGIAGGGTDEPGLNELQVGVRVYEVGQEMGVSAKLMLAAFATVIVEAGGGTTMKNPMCYQPRKCDLDSVGAFQQRNFSPWTDKGRNRRNVRDAARTFFEQAAAKEWSSLTPGALADAVQRSAYPERYGQVLPVAREILARVQALSPTHSAALAGGGAARPQFVSQVAEEGGRVSEPGLVWPTVKAPITSHYGYRVHPILGYRRLHAGIDIGAPEGSEIYAVADGIVTRSQFSSGYGNNVCLRHGGFTTCYAHMRDTPLVGDNDAVSQGTKLGYVGHTGLSTAAHLHFEYRDGPYPNSPAVDPEDPELELEGAEPPTGTTPASAAGGCGITTPATFAGSLGWPLSKRGEIVGRPNEPGSTHDPATWPFGWQSDNAVAIAVPVRTPVLAVADGEVCETCGIGPLDSGDPQLAGERLTLVAAGTQIYYAHLSRITVRPGQRVRRGQILGYSGSANKVAHLHIALRDGDPMQQLGAPASASQRRVA